MKNYIDISTEEKKQCVFEIFSSFSKKSDIYAYYKISDNTKGIEYINHIAKEIGFDFSSYKKKRYCLCCGKELIKGQKKFCSCSCSAKYTNTLREPMNDETKEKIRQSLKALYKKEDEENKRQVSKKIEINICPNCGKEVVNHTFCNNSCSSQYQHKKAFEDFLKNPKKYCKGNYTPKSFKNEFLKEQNNKCSICGCEPYHNGKPLVFVLDHIDGDASNNKRENLRMICPNCDSQLDTYKSKNKNSKRRNYWKEHIIKELNNN